MAKKKQEEAPAGSPAWMATFSDLMNLLLCFFVLLFSMSSVDTAKFNELAQSLASSFSIFNAGGAFFGEGNLVANGAAQLNNLDEHTSDMGKQADSTVDEDKLFESQGGTTEELLEYYEAKVKELEQTVTELQGLEEALELQKKEAAGAMYDDITELAKQYNLQDYVDFGMDASYNFVKIDIKGSILFDSNSAEIKKESEAKSVLLKIGDILKDYEGYRIEIIGHTDNVPIRTGKYKDNDYLSAARAIETAKYLIREKNLDASLISFTGRGEREPVASNATPEGRAQNRRIEFRIYSDGEQ